MATAESFDGISNDFLNYSEHTRGAIRYTLAHENLSPYIESKNVRTVLDVCGGSGIDTAWLASKGMLVTMVEPSLEQVNLARNRFIALEPGIRARITDPLQMNFTDYQTERRFDLVTMHGVAMYQSEPSDYFKKAMSHVRSGGYLSVLEKGWGAAAERVVASGDISAIEYFKNTGRFINRHNREVTAFKPDELQDLLRSLGSEVTLLAGVRVVSDRINEPVKDFGERDLKVLLDIEREAGKDPSCVGMAQMLHLIVRKN